MTVSNEDVSSVIAVLSPITVRDLSTGRSYWYRTPDFVTTSTWSLLAVPHGGAGQSCWVSIDEGSKELLHDFYWGPTRIRVSHGRTFDIYISPRRGVTCDLYVVDSKDHQVSVAGGELYSMS